MNTKYQVFVSSTYEDLKEERQQVVRAILEMGHIPVGMEMFSAADEQQWQVITRHIELSDYYVVVAAHRYGSMDGNISYTEKEYDYAVAQGIPVLAFVIEDSAPWPPDKEEKEQKKRKALERFKRKLKSRYISYWTSASDLYGKVSIALTKQMTVQPRMGWVRADQAPAPEVLSEIARLSKENAELRARLQTALAGRQENELQPWRDFLNTAYDYAQAVWRDTDLTHGLLPKTDEQRAARAEVERTVTEVDKALMQLQIRFLEPRYGRLLRQAGDLVNRITQEKFHPWELTQFGQLVTRNIAHEGHPSAASSESAARDRGGSDVEEQLPHHAE